MNTFTCVRQQPMLRTQRAAGWTLGIMMGIFVAGCTAAPVALPPITEPPTRAALAGKIVWFDLLTENTAEAQAFYGALFGWTFEDRGGYALIRQNGRPIGGIAEQEDRHPGEAESIWLPSLSVWDVDAGAELFRQSGGRVLEAPADVEGRGRMAVVEDPQGAPLVLLRSSAGDPADGRPARHQWLWTDLFTTDAAAAVDFYRRLAPYDARTLEAADGVPVTVLVSSGKARAGVVQMPFKGVTPNWVPYVDVADLDDTIRSAVQSGGTLLIRVRDAAVLADPVGAAFGVQARPADEKGGAS